MITYINNNISYNIFMYNNVSNILYCLKDILNVVNIEFNMVYMYRNTWQVF